MKIEVIWVSKYGDRLDAPPGLLLISLGDGAAAEATEDMLRDAINKASTYLRDGGMHIDWPAFLAALIQQAQEKRDV